MTDLVRDVVDEAAAHFGTTLAALTPMAGGHSTTVYEFARDGTAHVLRIVAPNDEIRPADMEAIQAWLSYLALQGAPVPEPLQTTNGKQVALVTRPEGAYIAVASKKARGIRAETLSQAAWTAGYFRQLGRTAALLHRAAAGYRPPADLRRPDFLAIGTLFSAHQPATPIVMEQKHRVLTQLGALPKPPAHYGMIHGDFHFGNFFVDPAASYAVTVFDFDDCGYGWYMMDTATLLFDVAVLYDGEDRMAFTQHFLHHYLSGYRQVLAIEPFWVAQLPHFLKLLEISYYAMLAPGYEAGDDGDWWVARFMPGRRERVEGNIPYLDLDPVAILETID
ncbi:MAG: phosphotransferase [Anaerolineae bacterium]|nr:phosphotransferase [Anaerolineae bacterium]